VPCVNLWIESPRPRAHAAGGEATAPSSSTATELREILAIETCSELAVSTLRAVWWNCEDCYYTRVIVFA
jgi:hypothetical protein